MDIAMFGGIDLGQVGFYSSFGEISFRTLKFEMGIGRE